MQLSKFYMPTFWHKFHPQSAKTKTNLKCYLGNTLGASDVEPENSQPKKIFVVDIFFARVELLALVDILSTHIAPAHTFKKSCKQILLKVKKDAIFLEITQKV